MTSKSAFVLVIGFFACLISCGNQNSESEMEEIEIEIGVKMKVESGPEFIGMEKLRQLQKEGFVIKDIEEAGITMGKSGEPAENDDSVRLFFSGGVFKVTLSRSE